MKLSSRLTHFGFAVLFAASAAALSAHGARAQQTTTEDITPADQAFLQKAVDAGNQEIADGRAHQNSSDTGVRTFATTMVRDHNLANAKLEAVAKQFNVTLKEQTPTPSHADGASYVRGEVADHQQAIDLFQKEATGGSAAVVRSLAANTLPVLKQHLQMAQQYVSTGTVTPEPAPTNGNTPP